MPYCLPFLNYILGNFFIQLEILFVAAALRVVCIQPSACPVLLMSEILLQKGFMLSIGSVY